MRENMVLKAVGKVYMPHTTMRGGARIYIPSCIVLDSTFPLQGSGDVSVEIDTKNKALVIKPVQKR